MTRFVPVIAALLLVLFSALPARAVSMIDPINIAVSARVPLSPQQAMGIRKNSQVTTNFGERPIVLPDDFLTINLELRGLEGKPLKNSPVLLSLNSVENQHSLKIAEKTDSQGSAIMSVPISTALRFNAYHLTFSTTIENSKIDLLNTIMIFILRPYFSVQKNGYETASQLLTFPLETTNYKSYSNLSNFATLELLGNCCVFTKENIFYQAAHTAAARDGPVV